MKKTLTKSAPALIGMHPGITGNVSGITGDVSGITGNVSGIRGDLDACELTQEDRARGVNILDLVIS